MDLAEGLNPEDLFYAVPVDYSAGGAITEIPFAPHEASEDAGLYGIYLKGGLFDGYVLGVMYNAPHQEYIKKAVSYFLGN